MQNRKLVSFVNNYVYPFSPHYQRLFDQHGIDPKSIRSVTDLQKIPLTSKRDFVATDDQPEKFKEFVLTPDKKKIRKYWPITKTVPLMISSLIRGKQHTLDQLAREFRPSFMTFTTGTTNKPISYLYVARRGLIRCGAIRSAGPACHNPYRTSYRSWTHAYDLQDRRRDRGRGRRAAAGSARSPCP